MRLQSTFLKAFRLSSDPPDMAPATWMATPHLEEMTASNWFLAKERNAGVALFVWGFFERQV